ncbi:hypothetical protein AM588_10004972 [Phytophthora nicotianae]|uniref:Uncharacterized protein n=1 Tax=Phytophthora nicotianae TaxID=4792 RepID=A0A0W8D5S7_PHYNI|nr:hypothetical protein AM588_10004972 [Phytophthora nicotianae]
MITSRSGLSPWVDVDTPESAYNVTSSRGHTWALVMSDEFNVAGRNFTPGADHMWTALEMPDGVNAALEYYSFNMTDTVTESDGRGVFRIKIMEEENITYTVWNTYAKPAGLRPTTCTTELEWYSPGTNSVSKGEDGSANGEGFGPPTVLSSLFGAFVIVLLVFVVYKIIGQRSRKAMVGAGITQPAILSKVEMDDVPRSNKSQSGSEDKLV